MLVSGGGADASARRAVEEAYLDEVRLDNLLYALALLADRGRDGADADRPAVELLDDRRQDLAVDLVQAEAVNLHLVQGAPRHLARDAPVVLHLGVVAHAAEQAVGDARRAARAPRYLARARSLYLHAQNLGGAVDDDFEVFARVEVEVEGDAEAPAQRRRDEAGARRRAD